MVNDNWHYLSLAFGISCTMIVGYLGWLAQQRIELRKMEAALSATQQKRL